MIFSMITNAALAFAPNPDVQIGIEPVRIYSFTSHQQKRLKKKTSWQSFVQSEGSGWEAVFDQHSKLPFRAWGPGLDLGEIETPQDAIDHVRQFLMRHPNLLGNKGQMGFAEAAFDPFMNAWHVSIEQQVNFEPSAINDLSDDPERLSSAPVWRGGFRAFFKDGKLTMFGSAFYPELSLMSWHPGVTAKQAYWVSVDEGPAPNAEHEDVSAQLILLPFPIDGVLDFRLCWEIRSKTNLPKGHWVSFVDAESGQLLNRYNEVRFYEGSLLGEHEERTVGSSMLTSPLSQIRIPMEPQSIYTNPDGSYSIDGEPESIKLLGLRTRIQNSGGDDYSFEITGGEQIISSDSDEEVLAQIDQFVFQNIIYEWAEDHAPHIVDSWPRSTVNVNINDNCNAFWDGELNFYTRGEGCNNTARISDVSYHEWGHGFHYHSLLSGEYDGAMSEGISDIVSFLQTRDYIMAPGFFTNGGGIREVSTDRVYPDDIVNEVHADGLIFGGAIWDYLNIMKDELGEEEAYSHVSDLLAGGIRSGPTLPESYYALLFADDDNANLSDGTPHQCQLIEAFGRHGLGPGGIGLISLNHVPLSPQPYNLSAYPISVDIEQLAPNCITGSPSDAMVWFSVDGGDWQSAPLEIGENLLSGDIPGAEPKSVISYYVTLIDDEGRETSVPEGKAINPFTFFVGDLEEILCNDFEENDGGFTHELVSGQNQAGADDWMWGEPIGLGGDPGSAYSGTKVWGNDLGGELNGENYNGEYQNQKWNRLTTPDYDVAEEEEVVLIYQRWLSVEDGYYDQARILANGEVIWTNHATREAIGDEHHQDQQWVSHAIRVDTSQLDVLNFSWEVETDRGLTMGGWTIDDFCLYKIAEPAPLEDETVKDGGACGCSSATNPLFRPWWLLVGLVALRRRS